MKSTKGFTLVELLAVVAILSLLVIITLPNIMDLFNTAKRNSFSTELKNIYKSAQNQWMSDSMFNTEELVYSNCNGCTGKKLPLSGRQEIKYYIKIAKSGNIVEYCSTDDTYQYYYDGNNLSITDIENIEDVAKTSEDMNVEITPDGCERKGIGKEITVCYFSSINPEYAIGTIKTKQCFTKQSFSECFQGTGITPNYLYTTETSNPNPKKDFDDCRRELDNSSSSDDKITCYNKAPNFEYCIRKCTRFTTLQAQEAAYASCTYNDSFFKQVLTTDKLSSQNNGCYSQVRYSICLDGESEVEVYDKKKKKKLRKKLKDITYDDLILCWDFNTGKYTYEKPLWIMIPFEVNEYIRLTFSDGTTLNVMGDHRMFNLDSNMFTSCLKESESPIGMNTINEKGEVIQLIDRKIIHEKNTAYNVIINKHINLYANGILTSRGLNNLYPIKDMKFVKENREVFSREELNEIPDEYFYGLNIGETPRNFMGSEKRTKEQLLLFIERTINTKKGDNDEL